MAVLVRPRSEIPVQYTWNAPSLFASNEEWQAAFEAASASMPQLGTFRGRLAEGPAVLLDFMNHFDGLYRQVGKLYVYAGMMQACETTDPAANAMVGQAMGLFGMMLGTSAFLQPELLAIGQETLERWMTDEPSIALYRPFIEDLFRKQAHVRSAEVEELLGTLVDTFGGIENTAEQLANADIQFEPATSSEGEVIPITQGSILSLVSSPDRETRRTAWQNYHGGYLAFKNTFASNLITSVKRDVFLARARRYESSLAASLFENNVPVTVFHNLIDTYRRNIPTWHRYWAVRRKALGVESLHPWDIWAPLAKEQPVVLYEQAVEMIADGMEPLGSDYVSVLRAGCLKDRWVDVFPNIGKRQGAFSSGFPGTHPFIMMSYAEDLKSMSTLAHELGHSMHSYLSWKNQPFLYANYTLFVAEVASNFNQAMVRARLMETHADDGQFQIALIEEAMNNFHRYFFIMPTLARFELEIHERIERGQGVTAEDMNALMADLFAEGYGSEMDYDRDLVGITWATFGHLYNAYYVYQYATGISAAHALAEKVRAGSPDAAQRYVEFLSAGGSLYPLDALKHAGVDMATPEAVETTFGVLADYVDRLDRLTGA